MVNQTPDSKVSLVLSDKMRTILFWVTIGVIVGVVIVALFTFLRGFGGQTLTEELGVPELVVAPGEVTLCLGQSQEFTVNSDSVTWVASGGTMTEGGVYVPGGAVGDFIIEAQEDGSERESEAIVHIQMCTPTPPPTFTPLPTMAPTDTPVPVPTVPPVEDAQGDVGTYDSGAPVDGVPAGVDIRSANVALDLSVSLQPVTGIPDALAGWVQQNEGIIWLTLWNPIPDAPSVYTQWLVALDLDGNLATGRPAGAGRINPDFGDEVAIGLDFDPATGVYEPYYLVWDSEAGNWIDGTAPVRFFIDDSRTVVALALPMDVLAQIAGSEGAPQTARGRVAVLSYVDEQSVIDFFPDRP